MYEGFSTAHSLFGIPVVEDEEDYDHEAVLRSTIKPERKELLMSSSLIVWDEFLSNHKQCLQTAYNVTDRFKNKIVICMGDYRQIAPVVVNGSIADIIRASVMSSHLWKKFQITIFSQNMRLTGLISHPSDSSGRYPDNFTKQQQQDYADMLLDLGEGYKYSDKIEILVEDTETGSALVRLPLISAVTDKKAALSFIFPGGFDANSMHRSSILAATNEDGDEWNALVQDMNPNLSKEYFSADVFDNVDDEKGFVREMMTTEALNGFNKNGCPPHKLNLKVNDICIILRNLNKREGLTNNTRVRITQMNTFSIRVQTLTENPKSHILSRIRFKFKIPFGHSFTMTRTQFPLRLAYCMTFNKAQGQEWDKVLADIRRSPFTHGHLYVVASRIRQSTNILMYCADDQILEGSPCATNVVYKKLKI